MKTAYDIIRRPVITEASMDLTKEKKYVFEVRKDATKLRLLQQLKPFLKAVKVAESTP